MIPFLSGIRHAIYNLNKRIDLLTELIRDMFGIESSSILSLINILNDKDASTGILNTLLQKADKTEIPKNTSDLINDSGYVTQQNVVANEAFPSNWPKSGNMSGLISAINQDDSATQGKIYLATVSYDDLPTGLMLAEMKVEITVGGSGSKVILFTITSENVAPYHWEYTSAYGRSGHWRSFLTSHQDISGKLDVIDSNHKLSSDLVDDTNKTHKFVTDEEKQTWNNKSNFSGSYNNLLDKPACENANGHDYVEIGGIKWATMNIGASQPSDYGLYFQWGDTQGYTAEQMGSGEGQKYFGWADYKYGNGTSNPGETDMTKYNSTDGKTVLDTSDDAARANWGGSWRMPTTAEFQALGSAVNTVWTYDYQGSGVAGIICTDKINSSKTLFFPAVGYYADGSFIDVGNFGLYWSSSLYTNKRRAYRLLFSNSVTGWDNSYYRFFGFAVRPILDLDYEFDKVAFTGNYDDLKNKPTYSSQTAVENGNNLSLVTTGEKYIWNNKANIWSGTLAEYDLLTPDPNTIYVITPAPL